MMQRRQLMTLALGSVLAPLTGTVARAAGPVKKESPAKIAWFGTWKEGLAEARRSGRPILLIAAAPHCHNVSGLW